MRIEVLGSGGSIPIPRPFCFCPVCEEARAKGIPYARGGPSLFIHDLKLLIDTPEDISAAINRARIPFVESVMYSHWHPDHTAGIRVWEGNYSPGLHYIYPPVIRTTTMYLPENVEKTFHEHHALFEKGNYQESLGLIRRQIVPVEQPFTLHGVTITPFALAESYVCGFHFAWSDGETPRRMVICMDEITNWQPPAWFGPLDLLVLPAGLFEYHPLSGERNIALKHPLLKEEITYQQTLDLARSINPKRLLLIHISETEKLSYDELTETARRHNAQPSDYPPLTFAHDTLCIEV